MGTIDTDSSVQNCFKMIVGLGNPGQQYADTRHNIGFALADLFFQEHQSIGSSADYKEKYGAQIGQLRFKGDKLFIVKPLKYMNLSGEPVGQLMHYYRIDPKELIVVHDDIDLPFDTLRIKSGGGDGGHKGIKSICSCIGSSNFVRLKLGVGRPEGVEQDRAVSGWVLGSFNKEEQELLDDYLNKGLKALLSILENGVKQTQNIFNRKEEVAKEAEE